ncbi:uncharacterized protein [Symphalangus syndactylus]|uniref:uncharacterized protein n=1 Tax=Symphalangus syndactylus TaxID=9590 RepID=UPI003005F4B9
MSCQGIRKCQCLFLTIHRQNKRCFCKAKEGVSPAGPRRALSGAPRKAANYISQAPRAPFRAPRPAPPPARLLLWCRSGLGSVRSQPESQFESGVGSPGDHAANPGRTCAPETASPGAPKRYPARPPVALQRPAGGEAQWRPGRRPKHHTAAARLWGIPTPLPGSFPLPSQDPSHSPPRILPTPLPGSFPLPSQDPSHSPPRILPTPLPGSFPLPSQDPSHSRDCFFCPLDSTRLRDPPSAVPRRARPSPCKVGFTCAPAARTLLCPRVSCRALVVWRCPCIAGSRAAQHPRLYPPGTSGTLL